MKSTGKKRDLLKENEAPFRAVMEQSSVSIQIHTPDGKLFESNAAYAKLYALSKETLKELYEKYNVLNDPQIVKLGIQPFIERVFAGESVNFPEYEYDGIDTLKTLDFSKPVSRKCWMQTRGFPIKDKDGKVTHAVFMSEDITDKKKTEEELKKSDLKFKTLVTNLEEIVFMIDIDGTITLSEGKGLAKLGLQPGEAVGKSIFDLYKNFPKILSDIKKTFTGETVINEEKIRDQYLRSWYTPHKNQEGETIGLLGLSVNITNQRRAESELQESEERFRATFEQAAAGIAHVDLDGRFLRINQQFCDLLGSSMEEMLVLTFQNITHPDDLDTVVRQGKLLLKGEQESYSMEKRYFHKKGHIVWVNYTVSLVKDQSGDPLYFVSVVENINARKEAEEEARISADRFQKIFQTSSASITISKLATGVFTEVNQAFEQTFGYAREEIVGKSALDIDIWKNKEDRDRFMPEFLEKGNFRAPALELIRKSGETAIVDAHFSIMKLEDENYSIAVFSDITEQKEAEKKINQYQLRLKAMASELLITEEQQRKHIATDLHDQVGQLLAASLIQLATITDDMSKQEILSKKDEIAKGLLQAIKATRNAIFELSPPQLNEIGLLAALSDWIEVEIEGKYEIKVRIKGEYKIYPLTENIRHSVFRWVRELLFNVVKHAQARKVILACHEQKGYLKVIVSDDGNGFKYTPGMLRREGSGFGLFSIQERINNLGGSMEIRSSPRHGTIVTLTVPLARN